MWPHLMQRGWGNIVELGSCRRRKEEQILEDSYGFLPQVVMPFAETGNRKREAVCM